MIHEDAVIAETASIGPNVSIGADTIVFPGAFIEEGVKIGRNCVIGPGTAIGQVGFGYEPAENGAWKVKIHEFSVVIEDNVDIGANSAIDRGSWRDTVIGRGTKVDNLVHVAHNVQIGRNCMIVAHAMLAGSVVLEDNVWIGPHACVNQRLRVREGGFVGTGAVVTREVPEDTVVAGVPAKVLRERRETDC